ncbi:exonuclease [Nitzschia inconspicua]|uniref:Exonuclease n=1 Tax=Nitzschia inconspicua TaxID=303405 RepID=A0A9K3KF59_9STRA|nr:exonuclease [Nitzschia inconspicua]
MPSSKKYTLYSAKSAAPGEIPLCAFFHSEAGCRNGDKCKFSHGSGGVPPPQQRDHSVEVSENSSVVSSESEGEGNHQTPRSNGKKNIVPQLADDPFTDAGPPQSSGNKKNQQGKEQPAKKKKRKSTDRDVFAGPKGSAAVADIKNEIKETPNKKAKKSRDVKDVETSAQETTDLKRFLSTLPVASFSIPDTKSTPVQKKEQEPPRSNNSNSRSTISKSPASASKKETRPRSSGIAISSPDVAKKWQKVVEKTRQHERYDTAYDFARYKDIDAQNGIKGDWIKAKPFGSWCKTNPQAIAIDCEMCETQDPLSGAKNSKALCRLSVVNADDPTQVLLDTLVKPSWPVTDYRTRINGVTKEHLDSVEFTLRHAQAFMVALCSEETVIVGHAVHNDLAALNMEHDIIADSSFLFRAKDSTHATVSLKDTVRAVLKSEMPETHDSVNDARKALECVLYWMKRDGKVDLIERTAKQSKYKGHQLFVHRIPKQCQGEHLTNMFLKHTTVQPVDVDEIVFSGNTGKTHVSFKSPAHANLAFDSIDGNSEEDLSGRLQKKVYLRNGDYVRVRKMVRVVKQPSLSNVDADKADESPFNQEDPISSPDLCGANKGSPGDRNEPSYAPFRFRDLEHSKPSWWKE